VSVGWTFKETVGMTRLYAKTIQVVAPDGARLDITLESAMPITDDVIAHWKQGHADGSNTANSTTIARAVSPMTGQSVIILPKKAT